MISFEDNDPRFRVIEQKIISMAKGNMNTTIRIGKNNDILDSISTALNMLSDNWKERLLYVPFHTLDHYQKSIQVFSLIVSKKYVIESITAYGLELLNMSPNQVIHKYIFDFFSQESKEYLMEIFQSLNQFPQRNHVIPLQFFHQSLIQTYDVHIQYSILSENYMLQFIGVHVYQQKIETNSCNNRIKQRRYLDLQIQKVYDYLSKIEHFGPNTMEYLCKEFGLNDYTLKHEFKRTYNTSPYKYYMNKRIERAKYLIENTSISLKKIAQMSGFSSYKTFHTNFITFYKKSPRELRKN